jgi:hypothetical protein
MVGGGRLWFARTTVNEAAQSAVRSGSLARSAGQAARDADSAARVTLATGGLLCTGRSVNVDTGAFSIAVGTPATITATVECSVPFSDLLLPGMPGVLSLKGSAASALDTYRSRQR